MAVNYTEIAQLLVKANAGKADLSRPPFGKVEAMLGRKLTKTSQAAFRAAWEAACDHWLESHSPTKAAPKKASLGRRKPLQMQRATERETAAGSEAQRRRANFLNAFVAKPGQRFQASAL